MSPFYTIDNDTFDKITDRESRINIAKKISSETAAEIKRVEDYLNSLRKLQVALNPPPKKRKYTKRKKALAPDSAPKQRPGRPRKTVDVSDLKGLETFKLPGNINIPYKMGKAGEISTVPYEITNWYGSKNIKKSKSRKKVV